MLVRAVEDKIPVLANARDRAQPMCSILDQPGAVASLQCNRSGRRCGLAEKVRQHDKVWALLFSQRA